MGPLSMSPESISRNLIESPSTSLNSEAGYRVKLSWGPNTARWRSVSSQPVPDNAFVFYSGALEAIVLP